MSVKSASRTIDLIEHVAHARQPLTAQQLSDALGIPGSSLSYLLSTMVARGWLVMGERRTYRIGPGLSGLLAADERPPVERAAPIVRWLRMQLNETCGYFEAQGDELLARVSDMSNQALNYSMAVGARGPLHAFAAGKVLLAYRPKDEQETYLAQRELRQFTDYTLISKAKLRKDLALIRQRGYALSEHEHTLGLISLAAPVGNDGGRPTGAISVAVPSVRFDDAFKDRALGLLKVAQRRFLSGMAEAEEV
jgi:IclR family acetate operon transcriptional repressor